MANTGFFHHIGTFLLFAAAILLLITCISAPVVNPWGLLKITLKNGSHIEFGTFGHCVTIKNANDACSGSHIGYNPVSILSSFDTSTQFSTASENTTKALTRVMVLHPVACGLAFIAFLLAAGSGVCGAIFASMVSLITFIITLVVTATDFALFAIIRNKINDNTEESGVKAKYSVAIWTELAALILLLLGAVVVLFTCCSSRMHRQDRHHSKGGEAGYVGTTTTKRRFWQRRNRY